MGRLLYRLTSWTLNDEISMDTKRIIPRTRSTLITMEYNKQSFILANKTVHIAVNGMNGYLIEITMKLTMTKPIQSSFATTALYIGPEHGWQHTTHHPIIMDRTGNGKALQMNGCID